MFKWIHSLLNISHHSYKSWMSYRSNWPSIKYKPLVVITTLFLMGWWSSILKFLCCVSSITFCLFILYIFDIVLSILRRTTQTVPFTSSFFSYPYHIRHKTWSDSGFEVYIKLIAVNSFVFGINYALKVFMGLRGRNRRVVSFRTTYAISTYDH